MLRLAKGIALPALLLLGIVAAVGFSWAQASQPKRDGGAFLRPAVTGPVDLRDDARVRAFVQAYGALIDSVTYGEGDVVFALGGRAIHFQDGRMLAEGRLDRAESCDPVFYAYSLKALNEPPVPPPADANPRYCTDVMESLWGRTEEEIRGHGRSVTFLDRKMFLNDIVIDALGRVERDILDAAREDPTVRAWVADLAITYSFIDRAIAGSSTRSQHAWGMAVDLVPSSYGGRAVYWRWSRVFNREDWHSIPLEQRWSPPGTVIEIFERNGFVWGGKWTHFDNVHFEYRPEILLYNRLLAEGRTKPERTGG